MKERGQWRFWILSLLLAGNLCIQLAECQSYNEGGARGDEGDNPQSLGFDGVLQRHDGYVKGETPTIPQTSFSCSAQPYNPGLYADVETQCQVYHVCFEDRQESFLCGPGTNFNQRILACDFWYNFDCQDSPSFYNVNADIGKVPDAIFRPGQSRVPEGQQPSYPSYPRQPEQPPSVGSYPPRVSIPPPPPRNDPQPPVQRPETPVFQPQPPRVQPEPPRIQPQPPRIQPQPPRIQPQPPRIQPQPPRIQPQPQPPRIQPQPPSFQPQPPSFQPQPPSFQPQPPSFQPQPPSFQPQPPRIQPQPQPPRIQPQPQPPRIQPQPPAFRPQPPSIGVKPQYPSQPSGHGTGGRTPQQPYPPSIQQEEDSGYQFDGYKPPKPVSLPPPPPPHPQTPRPAFPPVVSPPRVSRPPLTPPVIRQPEGSISRPRIPVTVTRPEYHPDANLKGNVGYQPPQQPRIPQPSRPVGSGYPSYPVSPRPVAPRPVSPRPVAPRPVSPRPVAPRPVSPRPVSQRPVAQRPVGRPPYVPPPAVQQEHVDTEYVPPPPPPPPKQPSRPTTSFVPPPVQQEVTNVGFTKPPQRPSRPISIPPPVQQPIDPDYGKPQPPVAPSIINEQQKPAGRPSSRPQVSVGIQRPPQRPKPVFPPPSDHPNSNIKGGPGYNQPPPQIPRFEPTRIGRPSNPQGGYVPPQPVSVNAVKPTSQKRPSVSTSTGYKPPQQDRIKKPSEPARGVYQPPIQVIDHPQSEIKGADYRDPIVHQQPQRIKSPSTSVSGVKLPQGSGGRQQPQTQRPRAPIVVSRPQPPSIPATVKRPTPVDSQLYEKTRPQPPAPQPARIKQPSQIQSVSRPSQPRVPSRQQSDHPNANVKGGSGYNPSRQPSRPSGPPSSPSTAYEQKTTSTGQKRPVAGGYPSPPSNPSRGDGGYTQQVVQQQDYQPQRRPGGIKTVSPSGVKTASPSGVKTISTSGVKSTGGYQPQSASQQGIQSKVPKPDYDAGSSYTRGPDVYPKPEFGQPSGPYQPISTPSRSSQTTKQGSPSQNTITQSQNKPAYQGSPASSGFGTQVRPDSPSRQIPGYQPPYQPQVFPHRENPDHPNESLKGSGAYRPPPPAGFQAAASEVKEQKVVPETEQAPTALLGDIGAE